MCGIAGKVCYRDARYIRSDEIQRMGDVLAHRGPDGQGTYIDDHCGFAHRRLSIIDVEGGAQPIYNEDGTKLIIFNGEIYNYRQLRTDLEKKGHSFRTNSDTETILHLYEEEGVKCVNSLNGMFSFAIWDRIKKELFLARDRLGIKPLYYAVQDGAIIFASELKAIILNKEVSKDIDLQSLSDYFSFLYVPAPKTIFKNIFKLPAGHTLFCTRGGPKIEKYWDVIIDDPNSDLLENEHVERILSVLKDSVKCRLMSEVPLGAFLSGGIDSSVVVALMQEAVNSPVNTCTIGFKEHFFDESADARSVAKHLGTKHREFIVKPDILGILKKVVWHLDEPFADASSIPTYYLCEMARKNVTVALAGDGGDEVFAGYTNYVRGQLVEKLKQIIPTQLTQMLSFAANRIPSMMKGRTFIKSLIASEKEGYFYRWTYFKADTKKKLFSKRVARHIEDFDSFRILQPYFHSCTNGDYLSQWQYVDIKTYLVDDILMKVDKMSMAHSLEVRVPLLDHRLVELALSMPTELKIRQETTKYILKQCAVNYLPEATINKTKHGFLLPIGEWFRRDLKNFAEDMLFGKNSVCNDYFDTKFVRKLWDIHQSNTKRFIDLSMHLWSILVFTIWHRAFVDSTTP
jgi:asparagine synthase (glutamine-hydrolysing)